MVPDQRMKRALAPAMKDFQEQPCVSGVSRFQTLATEIPEEAGSPSSLVDILSQRFAVVLVLHFQRMQIETPDELQSAHPMFDWLPRESAFKYGPILVDYGQLCSSGCVAAIDQLWGHDGCLVFLGEDPRALFDHVSGLIHRGVPGLSEEGGLFYFCWPSVIGQLLSNQPAETAQIIFGEVTAGILTGLPSKTPGWQIFAHPQFSSELEGLGMRAVQPTG